MKSIFKKYYTSLGRFKALYLISAIELLVIVGWSVYTGTGMTCIDTCSYYDAYDVISSGKLDVFRTPLYPLLIGSAREIFGMTASNLVVYLLQSILFLFSIKWIGRTLDQITRFKKISYWFTAVYAIYPGGLSFCGVMMTESLAISLSCAVVYVVSEAFYQKSCKKAVLSGVISLLVWMLRPSMMAIPVILTIMWCMILLSGRKKMLKTAFYGFVSTMFSLACLGLYVSEFYNEYHKFGVTAVSTWNNYITLRESKVIDVAEIDYGGLELDLDSLLNAHGVEGPLKYTWWKEVDFLHHKYGIAEFDKFVSYQILKHPKELIFFLYRDRLEGLLDANCVSLGEILHLKIDSLTRIIRVNNGTVFLIFIIGFLILIYDDIIEGRISYVLWFLFSMFIANYFIVWIGAPDAFTRLLAQNYPILIAISCWVLDRLCILATLPNNKIGAFNGYIRLQK